MPSRCSVSIVIPAWNEWELTRACLESLRPTMGLRDEVIVVDNGSEDGTAKGLTRFPWAKVVTHEENKGFAAGCNAGAAVATGDVIVFLNNDTLGQHGRRHRPPLELRVRTAGRRARRLPLRPDERAAPVRP
jgi:GT2 family glycosyltransferase